MADYSTLGLGVVARTKELAAQVSKDATAAGNEAGGKLSTALGKGAKEGGSRIGSVVKGTVATAAGALSGLAVGAFIKESITGWRDHQQVLAQTAAVIKSTGGAAGVTVKQMDGLSSAIESNTGVDGDNILAGQNMLLTFTNIKNGVGDGNDVFNQATQTLTDMSVAMGTDTKTSAIQLGKALNDPIKGVTALQKVGVTFTDAQKKQIKTLVDTGHTMDAQKVILAELNKEFGGSAKAQNTAGKQLAVSMHNLEDSVGQALLPVINGLVNVLTKYVVPAFMTLLTVLGDTGTFIQSHQKLFIGLGIAIGAIAAVTGVYALVQGIATGALAAWFAETLVVRAATLAWTAAQWLLNIAMSANPIVLVVVAVAALVAAIVLAYQKSETFRSILQGVWDFLKTWGPAILAIFLPVLGIPLLIWQHWSQISGFLSKAWSAIWNVIKTWGPVALAVLAPFIGIPLLIWQHWSQIAGFAKRAFDAAIGAIKSAATTAYNAAVGFVTKVVGAIAGLPGKIAGLAGKLLSAGKDFIGGLWKGIREAITGAGSFAADIGKQVVNAIVDAINNGLNLPIRIGGQHIGPVHLPKVTVFPSIPRIAQGGLTLGPQLALVGDNPSGNELVLPMDSARTINTLAAAMAQANRTAGYGAGQAVPVVIVNAYLDGQVIDHRADARIEYHDQASARALLAGR